MSVYYEKTITTALLHNSRTLLAIFVSIALCCAATLTFRASTDVVARTKNCFHGESTHVLHLEDSMLQVPVYPVPWSCSLPRERRLSDPT